MAAPATVAGVVAPPPFRRSFPARPLRNVVPPQPVELVFPRSAPQIVTGVAAVADSSERSGSYHEHQHQHHHNRNCALLQQDSLLSSSPAKAFYSACALETAPIGE